MRGELRTDRTTHSGLYSVCRERLFRILSTEMNWLDLHSIEITHDTMENSQKGVDEQDKNETKQRLTASAKD